MEKILKIVNPFHLFAFMVIHICNVPQGEWDESDNQSWYHCIDWLVGELLQKRHFQVEFAHIFFHHPPSHQFSSLDGLHSFFFTPIVQLPFFPVKYTTVIDHDCIDSATNRIRDDERLADKKRVVVCTWCLVRLGPSRGAT